MSTRSRPRAGVGIIHIWVVVLSLFCTATVRGQLTVPVRSPSGTLVLLNVGEGRDQHFEIQDTEAGYRTLLSSAELQFRSKPISKAAVDAAWSPDSSSVAIEIALNKSTAITCVYSRQGETFLPLPLDVFRANHKVVPLGWHGSHDLIVSIDGPCPAAAAHPAHGRLCTFRFRPDKSRFEKVYEAPPTSLKPARLLLYLDKSRDDNPHLRKLREKHRVDHSYFWRRDTAVVWSGSNAEDAMANLQTARRYSSDGNTSLYSLGVLVYLDEHDRARFVISTNDAPRAEVIPATSDTAFIWTTSVLLPLRPDEQFPTSSSEKYIARDFYRKLLPELWRVNPEEMKREDDFFRRTYGRSLEEVISKMYNDDSTAIE